MNTLNQFFFGIYPYIALTVFLLGSLVRFEREQYTWKTDSLAAAASRPPAAGQHPVPRRHPGPVLRPRRRPADAGGGLGHAGRVAFAQADGRHGGRRRDGRALPDRPVDPDPPPHERSAHRRHHRRATSCCCSDPGHAAAGPVDHRAVRRPHGRRGDGQSDDLGAAHRHLPGRRRQPHRRRLAGVQGAPVHGAHAVRDFSLHPAGARLERLLPRWATWVAPGSWCVRAEPRPGTRRSRTCLSSSMASN